MKYIVLAVLLAFFTAPGMAPAYAQAVTAAPPAKFVAGGGMLGTFMFEDLGGAEQSLMPYVGQNAMVVNFWATWCPPCVKEMPSLDKLAAQLKDTNVKVFAIAVQTETAEVSGFFKRARITTLKPYMDRKMQSGHAVPMRGLPTTIIINSNGQIIGHVEGDIDWAEPSTVAWLKSLN